MLERIPLMSPSRRHSGLRRAANFLTAHGALVVCALFLLVGVALAGDYGLDRDETGQRGLAATHWDYILGHGDLTFDKIPVLKPYIPHEVYGISFQLPLLLAERALGLEDYYDIHRLRLFLTHLFFIAGGFCCYLLTWRLFNNRLLALLALLLYVLHPRIYAHSYFNSKDLPFLSMFSIALYLLERALRRDTVGAFALLGVAVGILTDLRIMGIMLLPGVWALRGLDWIYAVGRSERRRILVTAGLFTLLAAATLYALSPWLWINPGDYFITSFRLTTDYLGIQPLLFRGELIYSTDLPPDYLPTWFSITTPPLVLLLGFSGMAAVVGRGVARPGAFFGNTRLRFGALLLACFVLTALAVIILGADAYNDWRHLYYLYVPFALLAAWGVHWLAGAFRGRRRGRVALYGLAGAGLGLIALQIVQLHPLQYIYFNFLVDRSTPEYLKTRYQMGLWNLEAQDALKALLERYPGETLNVWAHTRARGVLPAEAILPAGELRRLEFNATTRDPDFALVERLYGLSYPHRPDLAFNSDYIHQRIYNNAIVNLAALDGARMTPAALAAYRELYDQARTRPPIIRAPYDIHFQNQTLTFIRENCQPGDRKGRLGVKVYPAGRNQPTGHLPAAGDYAEFYNLGVGLDGRCLAVIRLPDYPIAQIIVGQGYSGKEKYALWEEWHSFAGPDLGEIVVALRDNSQQTALRSDFEVFLESGDGGKQRLIYYKGDCSRQDYQTRFQLHIYPVEPAALPPKRRAHGFANQDFLLSHYGGWPGGECFAIVPLPDYPIAEIHTGQADLWEGILYPAADPPDLRAADAGLFGVEPDARSFFDLYLRGKELIYRRESCTEGDAVARFFLHIVPVDAADLLPERREHGFANRDFPLARQGGRFDGKCLATVSLPDYPIAQIRTGQYIPGQGQLWAVELAIDR